MQKFVVKHADGSSVTQAQTITLCKPGTQTQAYPPFQTDSSGVVTKSIVNGPYDAYTNGGCCTAVLVPTVPQITLQNACAT